MLDKLVIHLKNVIFFKAVVYMIALISLFLLIPVIQDDLTKSLKSNHKAHSYLQAADLKLNSIINFEGEIHKNRIKYDELIKQNDNLRCANRTKLMHNIKHLAIKYELFEPIRIDISRIFNNIQTPNSTGHIKLHNYELNIKFKPKDYKLLFIMTQEIYNLMPKGAVVVSININSIDALTPKIVNMLNKNIAPAPINAKIKIHLREIVYE